VPAAESKASEHDAGGASARWEALGEAVAASSTALADVSPTELVEALEALAAAASSLAAAIRTGTSGPA
jgi:hypothetical protein